MTDFVNSDADAGDATAADGSQDYGETYDGIEVEVPDYEVAEDINLDSGEGALEPDYDVVEAEEPGYDVITSSEDDAEIEEATPQLEDTVTTTEDSTASGGVTSESGETGVEEPEDGSTVDSTDDYDLISFHPHTDMETLASREIDSVTVRVSNDGGEEGELQGEDEEGGVQPPPEWRPGGPEGGW